VIVSSRRKSTNRRSSRSAVTEPSSSKRQRGLPMLLWTIVGTFPEMELAVEVVG